MSRIHPAETSICTEDFPGKAGEVRGEGRDGKGEIGLLVPSSVFTVWKKSSMSFQGTDGFTVFDNRGKLAFRVDNYCRNNGFSASAALVLMDGAGKPLLTLKPQRLSFQQQWSGYRGEDGSRKNVDSPNLKLFSMRRPWRTRRDSSTVSTEAEIFMGRPAGKGSRRPDFRVEGSFGKRNCRIVRVETGEVVARIARKKVNGGKSPVPVVLSEEVFSLSVEAGWDSELVMAFVVVLDRICP